jgi:predicted site-specific integrase-resolvase
MQEVLWMGFQKAGQHEGVTRFVVERLAREGRITSRRLPNGRAQVLVSELRQVLENCTRHATIGDLGKQEQSP